MVLEKGFGAVKESAFGAVKESAFGAVKEKSRRKTGVCGAFTDTRVVVLIEEKETGLIDILKFCFGNGLKEICFVRAFFGTEKLFLLSEESCVNNIQLLFWDSFLSSR